MDELEKSVIQQMSRHVADGIIMNEEILSALLEKHIFPVSMIDIIRSQTTATKQVYKMMELLPKRGPQAFQGFIEVIQEDYPWIATKLLTELEDRQTAQQHALHNSGTNIQGKKQETEFVDIRDKVNTFLHKHFGQSKKLAEKEKKLISKFLKTELTNEQIRLESLDVDQSSPSDSDINEDRETLNLASVKEELYDMHVKVTNILPEEKLLETSRNFYGESGIFSTKDYQVEDMTCALVGTEVSKLCDLFAWMKRDVDACLSHFEWSNRANGLPTLVESLVMRKDKQVEDIEQMERRNADLIHRLSEMTEEVHSLEMQRVHKQRQLDAQTRELSTLRHEKYNAHDRLKQLEKDNQEHQITIETLKTQINQLQNPKSTRFKRGDPSSKSPTRKSNQGLTRTSYNNSTAISRQSYSSMLMFSDLKKRVNTNDSKLSVKYKR